MSAFPVPPAPVAGRDDGLLACEMAPRADPERQNAADVRSCDGKGIGGRGTAETASVPQPFKWLENDIGDRERQTVAHRGRRNADEALAVALATGRTLRDAAAGVGIAERTAARRWADPAFRRRVGELRGDMVARSLGRLADHMSDAAEVLHQLLAAESESVRLGAARSLLELGVKLRESVELEERLQALEARAERSDAP
jgi:hypothetical protein